MQKRGQIKLSSDRRGQITVFIIVGIVMITAISIIIYFNNLKATDEIKNKEVLGTNFITTFVDNCLERSAIEGMRMVFSQGGYYEFPADLEVFNFSDEEKTLQVPIYFKNEEVSVPSLDYIENEVAKAAEKELVNCVSNFESFEKEGFAINTGEAKVKVDFAEKTLVVLEYPLTIKKGNQEGRLDKFDVTILFNFKNKYTAITNYFIEQKKEPDSFLAGEFSDIAYENNHQFWFTQKGFNGENILIEFVYNEKLKSDPLVYSFGLIYDWIKVEEPEIIPVPLIPAIMKMETWNITEPGIHTLQVETTGENLTFYTEPDILPIDSKSGLITLDTNEFGNDEYLFYVIAFNEEGIIIESHVYINININPGNYPIIKPIGKLTAKVGEEFHYKVDISNKKEEIYLFTSKSYLFDIDKKTGEINFTPTKEDLGLHSVRVDVENEYGRTWQRWELEVK